MATTAPRARTALPPSRCEETDDELGTEPPDGIVGTPRLDDDKGQVGEGRHLRTKKRTDKLVVYCDLVLVHADHQGPQSAEDTVSGQVKAQTVDAAGAAGWTERSRAFPGVARALRSADDVGALEPSILFGNGTGAARWVRISEPSSRRGVTSPTVASDRPGLQVPRREARVLRHSPRRRWFSRSISATYSDCRGRPIPIGTATSPAVWHSGHSTTHWPSGRFEIRGWCKRLCMADPLLRTPPRRGTTIPPIMGIPTPIIRANCPRREKAEAARTGPPPSRWNAPPPGRRRVDEGAPSRELLSNGLDRSRIP